MLNACPLRDSFLTDSRDQWTALARPAETVPEHTACSGGCRYEVKFDGFRVAVVRTPSGARLWSRRGTDLTSVFPGSGRRGRLVSRLGDRPGRGGGGVGRRPAEFRSPPAASGPAHVPRRPGGTA